MTCAKCCEDFDIDPIHLLFPQDLDRQGYEFVQAHGLDTLTLAALRTGARVLPDGRVKIQHRCQHLTADARCAIYADRPQICRDYTCGTRPDCTLPVSAIPLRAVH